MNDVSFRCEPGTVTGFLGPNGAGKSTTMRMICGLTPPTSGAATVRPDLSAAPQPGPAGRRAARRLRAARRAHRPRGARGSARRPWASTAARVDELLELVGLSRARPSSASASTRSACASGSASPTRCSATRSVLVLDEPANGLDPEGIFWMRGLLRDFADRGGTVLLSSHLLREVEAVADQLIVIGNGRIVAQGSKDELLAGGRDRGPRPLDAAALARGARPGRAEAGTAVEPTARCSCEADRRRPSAAPPPTPAPCCSSCRPAGSGGLEQLFLTLPALRKEAGTDDRTGDRRPEHRRRCRRPARAGFVCRG